MDDTLNRKCEDLKRAVDRLNLISAHDALLILKSSISAPKLMYTLRTSPCANQPTLDAFDVLLRKGLAASTNTAISDTAWIQASLPVRDGGLGVRSVSKLAPSAFLASAASTQDLQVLIWNGAALQDGQAEADMESIWTLRHGDATPDKEHAGRQSAWDKASIIKDKDFLLAACTGQYDQARLRATAAPHSSDWLSALPISACGLRLDDDAIRVAVGLRLGVAVCEPHLCPCGHQVDARGSHCLACKRGIGRMQRHQLINDIVHRAFIRANIPASKEPAGLSRTDEKRPDGVTLIPWKAGRSLMWDVTVIDTVAASYVARSADNAGGAAEIAAERKRDKYAALTRTYDFCPIALETLGLINEEGLRLLSVLGRRMSVVTGDLREHSFLLQRLSIAIQRGNSVAVRGSFKDPEVSS